MYMYMKQDTLTEHTRTRMTKLCVMNNAIPQE